MKIFHKNEINIFINTRYFSKTESWAFTGKIYFNITLHLFFLGVCVVFTKILK